MKKSFLLTITMMALTISVTTNAQEQSFWDGSKEVAQEVGQRWSQNTGEVIRDGRQIIANHRQQQRQMVVTPVAASPQGAGVRPLTAADAERIALQNMQNYLAENEFVEIYLPAMEHCLVTQAGLQRTVAEAMVKVYTSKLDVQSERQNTYVGMERGNIETYNASNYRINKKFDPGAISAFVTYQGSEARNMKEQAFRHMLQNKRLTDEMVEQTTQAGLKLAETLGNVFQSMGFQQTPQCAVMASQAVKDYRIKGFKTPTLTN